MNSFLLIRILPCFIALCVSCFVLFLNNNEGYSWYFLHPLFFVPCYFLVLYKGFYFNPFRPFLFVFSIISTLRYVVLPLCITLLDYYGGRSPVEPLIESYEKAIFIMLWEILVCSALIFFIERKVKYTKNKSEFKLRKSNFIYYIFIIFAFAMVLINPKSLLYINFIVPSLLDESVNTDFLTNFTVYIFLIAKALIFIIILNKCALSNKSHYYLLSMIFLLLNILIYWGTNKSDILIAGIASLLVFYKVYGIKTLKYLAPVCIGLFLILGTVNSFRETQSISAGQSKFLDRTDAIQAYTGGVYNVAIALEVEKFYPEASEFKVLLYDVFRPMIGPNLLLKDKEQIYSIIYFNNRIWTNVDRRSQIIPMVGQANLFLGFIFSPLFSMIFIGVAYIFEKIYFSTRYIEVYYFSALAILRLGFMLGQNTMNMINDLSMNLFLFFIIYSAHKLFNLALKGK